MTDFRAVPSLVDLNDSQRCTIGGRAILPADMRLPICRNCGRELLLFLQFDIEDRWLIPFKTGSHFVLFMCPSCNEIPSFNEFEDGQLPAEYWEQVEGHFFTALFEPRYEEWVPDSEAVLLQKNLNFEQMAAGTHAPDTIRIGGNPFWLQTPERFICDCGSELVLISQIAENYGFEKLPGSQEQPDSFSADNYCLFLGNEIYIFGCPKQCNPRSIWITVQG